ISFGNHHVNDVVAQALTLTNAAAADGFSEALDASIGAASAGVTAAGSFSGLAAQASDATSLTVGLDTGTAGAKAGTATITLTSDGTGTSGLGLTSDGTQTVN